MKKLFLSLILIVTGLITFSQTYDVTISGTVTDLITGDPVMGQEINIMTDSLPGSGYFYYNTVLTDNSGSFVDIMHVAAGEQGNVQVYTYSCGMMMSQNGSYSANNNALVFDFQICNDTTAGCQAIFYYYPINDSLTIQFIDESNGNPTNWTWNFGDGNSSSEQNPEYNYAASGEYLVSLLIEGDSSCFSIYEQLVWVGDSIWPQDCQAMYFYYTDSTDNMTINFVDMSIVGGNPGGTSGTPDSWYWEFGDNNSSTEQNPTHTYAVDGEYQACLTITDSQGTCISTFCDIVIVGNWVIDCEAYFWYFPTGDTNNPGGTWNMQNINFVDASMGNPDTWSWDFGDGTTSNQQNPTHFFTDQGIYNVCLSISNSIDSCQSIYCEEIFVYSDTTIGCFTWYDYQINNLTVDFQAFLDGGSTSVDYTWSFGDGTTGSGSIVSHTYATDGIYNVLLSASDSAECYAEYFEMIWVGDNFTFDVEGYVHLQDSMMADFADVHLMTFDTLGYGLINVATTQIDGNGYYTFDGVGIENCIYFVQAELTTSSAYYGTYVPTYHLDAINWEMAWPIFPFPTGWTNDVYMAPVSSSGSGSGNISGTVVTEYSRELMSNIEIMLLDQNGNPVAYLRTNDDGLFSFDGLANGTYTVYTELVGIETIPFDITISDENNNSSVIIIVNNGQAVLGIDDIISSYIQSVDNIYPNPVTEDATINISIKQPSTVKVEILNQYGQLLYSNSQLLSNGINRIGLPSAAFAQGMYFVKVTAADNISTVRKFVKLK